MTDHRKLESLTKSFAKALRRYAPLHSMRLDRCTHKLNHPELEQDCHCASPYCGTCQRLFAEEESKLLRVHLQIVRKEVIPSASFLHFTATAPDCRPDQIRSTLEALKAGWQRLVRRKVFRQHCAAWFLTFDVIAAANRRYENAHIHAVIVMKPSYSGRYYLSAERWTSLWRECVDPHFYRSVNVGKRSNLERLASYVVKHNPKNFMEALTLGLKNPKRIVERQRQVKGLNRYTPAGLLRGLKAMPKKQGADDPNGSFIDLIAPNPTTWRRTQRHSARRRGRYEPIPVEEPAR